MLFGWPHIRRLVICSLVSGPVRPTIALQLGSRQAIMPPLTRSSRGLQTSTRVFAKVGSKRVQDEDAAMFSVATTIDLVTSTPVKKPKKRASPTTVTPTAEATPSSDDATDTQPHSKAPKGWEEIYSLVEELRQDRSAPCDLAGCEALADAAKASPQDFRFQALLSLMLSSQTKDATVGQAVRRMQEDGVATVSAIAAMTPVQLNSYINKVGFHNLKTKYIKETVNILLERYDGDIPPDARLMQELPGVGPKMAYICETVAWSRASGIGVDTHMHRMFNQLGWVKTKTPEQTRVQLEAWLPQEKWMDVNLLWVGFGQEVQQFKPKILRKALDCSQPKDALRLLKRCGVDYVKEGKKLGLEEEIRAAMQGKGAES